jgi:hypothetical protein
MTPEHSTQHAADTAAGAMSRGDDARGQARLTPEFPGRLWLLLGSGVYAALLVFIRGRPSLTGDAGVFVSVAGRLLHGDRLYVNVIDNKDPLFYYSHAGALAVLGWRGPFLLDIVWVAIAAASIALLLRSIGASRLTSAVGFVAYPLLLTGEWYYADYTQLAPLAFAPLIGWLWMRGRCALAGALLGLGVLFEVNLALVLASAPLALLLVGLPTSSVRGQLARSAAGLGAVLATAAAILAVLGELHGYLKGLVANISYSRDVLSALKHRTGIIGHLQIAGGGTGGPLHFAIFVIAFAMVGLLAVRTLRRAARAPRLAVGPAVPVRPSARVVLAALFLSSALATVITLALTAVWAHHDQMLAYPGVMLIAFATVAFAGRVAERFRTGVACLTAVVGIALLGGASAPADGPISTWLHGGHSKSAEVLERAAQDRFPALREITFAHLGMNDEEGVAAFLPSKFELACPIIGQYLFSPDLPSVLRCIRDAKPLLVLVTPTFMPMAQAPAAWNQFVAEGSSLLSQAYQRVATQQNGRGLIEVWALRGGAAGR